jgi:hypothetical protein
MAAGAGLVTDSETDTVPVQIQRLKVERVHGTGGLLAMAEVLIGVGDVEIILRGCRVYRTPINGIWRVAGPAYRHPGVAELRDAVLLPSDLSRALGKEITDGMVEIAA